MPRRIFGRQREQQALGQYDQLAGQIGQDREAASSGYLSRALEFDPSQAVSQYGQGFLDEATEQLGQQYESLTGSATGSGRLRSGFFQRDAGRMFQDFNRRVANAIAAQSMNAAQLSQRNTAGLGAYSQNLYGQQIDMIGGALDRSQGEENANQGGGFGGFLKKAAGTAAGFVGGAVAGPVGAYIGNKVGDWIGNQGDSGYGSR